MPDASPTTLSALSNDTGRVDRGDSTISKGVDPPAFEDVSSALAPQAPHESHSPSISGYETVSEKADNVSNAYNVDCNSAVHVKPTANLGRQRQDVIHS